MPLGPRPPFRARPAADPPVLHCHPAIARMLGAIPIADYPHALHGHYTDLSDPPDLYASLHEEQVPPPPEDMNPSDPDLVPHEQRTSR